MQTFPQHYGDLLGLDKSWRVVSVDLKIDPAEVKKNFGIRRFGISLPVNAGWRVQRIMDRT